MIEVLVHSSRPLRRHEWTKERMRMLRALRVPALVKSADTCFELLLLSDKISFVSDNEFLIGGSVLGKWLIVGEKRPNKRCEDSANEHPGQNNLSGGHIECRGAVCHHLGNIHFPPLMLGGWLQLVDAGRDFVDCIRLK